MSHIIPINPKTGMQQTPAQRINVGGFNLSVYNDGAVWVEKNGRGVQIMREDLYIYLKNKYESRK